MKVYNININVIITIIINNNNNNNKQQQCLWHCCPGMSGIHIAPYHQRLWVKVLDVVLGEVLQL